MLTLNHNDYVYLASWTGIYDDCTVQVGTVRGYRIGDEDPEEAHARAVERNHPVAWTLYPGTCLYGNKDEALRAGHRRRVIRAAACCIADGDTVLIEGQQYRVRVVPGNVKGPRNSDPIQFIPIT